MAVKVLIEFQIVQTNDGIKYRYKRGKRSYVSHAPTGGSKGIDRCSKTSQTKRRHLRQALDTLENMYNELYPPGNSA